MAATVNVKNIAGTTDDKEIKDFFSFCGKVKNILVTSDGHTKSATVTFEKPMAANTALLLNNTKLKDVEIQVTGAEESSDDSHHDSHHDESDEISQEEKPRSRIVAELLSQGYVVADAGLQSALALDEKHGISQRFVKTLQGLDDKYHATDRARTADQSYGITQRASSLWNGISSYFEKATGTPTGKRIVSFYTSGQRQVSDIHGEAKRLAELKKQEAGGSAYKAAGLHKVFGAEKPKEAGEKGKPLAPENATVVESQQKPTAPANVAGNNSKHTPIS